MKIVTPPQSSSNQDQSYDSLDVIAMIDEIKKFSKNIRIDLVYLSKSTFPSGLAKALPRQVDRIFECSSTSEFFQRRLHKVADFCIFEKCPARCSIEDFDQLLEKRREKPFETMVLVSENWERSWEAITQKTHSLCLKIAASEKFEESVMELDLAPPNPSGSIHQRALSNHDSIARSGLRDRMLSSLNSPPEEFLRQAIASIRTNKND